jgi:hypothetical protein
MTQTDEEKAVRNLVSIFREAVDYNRNRYISLETEDDTVVDPFFMMKRFQKHLQTCRFCFYREKGWCYFTIRNKKKVRLEGTCPNFFGGGPLYEEIVKRCYFPER